MNRRSFLRNLIIGGVATTAAVREWPFRVFSFPNYPVEVHNLSKHPSLVFHGWRNHDGIVKVSLELLRDSAFDLESYMKNCFVPRIEQGYECYFRNGEFRGRPAGILSAPSLDLNELVKL